MARQLLRDTSETARQIMDGELDAELDTLQQAIAARRKNMFRSGTRVRVHGANNAELNGQVGTVMRVNPKRISVGFGEYDHEIGLFEREYNIPPSMLEPVPEEPTRTVRVGNRQYPAPSE